MSGRAATAKHTDTSAKRPVACLAHMALHRMPAREEAGAADLHCAQTRISLAELRRVSGRVRGEESKRCRGGRSQHNSYYASHGPRPPLTVPLHDLLAAARDASPKIGRTNCPEQLATTASLCLEGPGKARARARDLMCGPAGGAQNLSHRPITVMGTLFGMVIRRMLICWHVLLHARVHMCCHSLTNPARTATSVPSRDRHDAKVGHPHVSTHQHSTQRNPHTPALKSKDAPPPEGTGAGTVRVLCGLGRSLARGDETLWFLLGICQGHLLSGLGCMPRRGQRAT